MQNGKKGEEGRKEGRREGESFYPCSRRRLFTALLPCLFPPPCSVPASTPFPLPSFLQHSFSIVSIHFRPNNRNVAHCSVPRKLRPRDDAAPHQFPPSSLNVTIPFPFVSGESNVVRLAVAPIKWMAASRAQRAHDGGRRNKWASSTIAGG